MARDKDVRRAGGEGRSGVKVDFFKYEKSILSFPYKIQLFQTQQSTIWKWTEVEQFKNNL